MKVTWVCKYCNDIVVSNSKERHQMDYCKCKKSAMDLEEHYSRHIGNIMEMETTE